MNKKFAVFILTHGRPHKVYTVNALRKVGYSGEIHFVVDDEDKTVDEYKELFGDKVHVFCKEEWLNKSDTFDYEGSRAIVLPARNQCFSLAEKLGLDYFLELDDDYTKFQIRYEKDGVLKHFSDFNNFDDICERYIEFLETNENILTVCFFQNGDYIGGTGGTVFKKKVRFKAMNSFFCKTTRPFQFYGRLNEDLTMSVMYGRKGKLTMTVGDMSLQQIDTQQNSGGLTDAYLSLGTYRKSFYSVVACPSCVKISTMGDGHSRIHHEVSWEKAHPYILSEKWKKK